MARGRVGKVEFEVTYDAMIVECGAIPERRHKQRHAWYGRFSDRTRADIEHAFREVAVTKRDMLPSLGEVYRELALLDASRRSRQSDREPGDGNMCSRCGDMGVVTLVRHRGAFYTEKHGGYAYSFRCTCLAGRAYSSQVAVYDSAVLADGVPPPVTSGAPFTTEFVLPEKFREGMDLIEQGIAGTITPDEMLDKVGSLLESDGKAWEVDPVVKEVLGEIPGAKIVGMTTEEGSG